jgi:putative PIN family toxin of toxin-antitoxin system
MVPRIVLDTNVLLSAFGWRGSPYEILRRTLQGEFRLLASPALLEELQRVLAYPKFGFSEVEIARFLLTIAEGAEVVLAPARLSVVAQDPADDRVLECAVAGGAHFIVSGDVHLKDLKSFQEIPILSPAEFLERFPS